MVSNSLVQCRTRFDIYYSDTSPPIVVNNHVPEHARHAVFICFAPKVLATVHVEFVSGVVTAPIQSPFIVVVDAMTAPVSFT